ncbi:MAG TPA: hypothetical protein VNF07_10480 [Acidimicrobiales bacterium]|nr:hypothetical protein [Acidimicrobiales bacterium]
MKDRSPLQRLLRRLLPLVLAASLGIAAACGGSGGGGTNTTNTAHNGGIAY